MYPRSKKSPPKESEMKSEKNRLVEQSPAQSNPYLCDPNSFEVGRADEFADSYVPGHGQCGANEKEYEELQKQADKRGKSPLGSKRTPATEASDAKAPHTDGMSREK